MCTYEDAWDCVVLYKWLEVREKVIPKIEREQWMKASK